MAVALAGIVLAAFGVAAPVALTPLPRLDGYIPAVQGIVAVTDSITAVLLFAQFAMARSNALLVLAGGYLFSSVTVVAQTLTFPGAFSPAGLFGASLQTAAWMYVLWHFGFAVAVMGYALLKPRELPSDTRTSSAASPIAWAIAVTVALAVALCWAILVWGDALPRLAMNATSFAPFASTMSMLNLAAGVLALALVWLRRSSLLDWWLMVAVCALITEAALISFIGATRYTVGFYSSRFFGLLVSSAVLVALLWEITRMYARLSLAVRSLERERAAKLMSFEVMLGAVGHEIKQPLTAIVLNAEATHQLLQQGVPDMDKLQESVEDMKRDSLRVSQVFENIRGLCRSADQKQQELDVNVLALTSLELLGTELKDREIGVVIELAPELPRIAGHGGQLQEVLLNLIRNAIEAMTPVTERARTLRVETKRHKAGVAISIEDSGCGIHPERIANLFDAFVSTKADGMGLGLGICRMIVDRHHGQISASSELGAGTRFEITLPIGPPAGDASSSPPRQRLRAEA